MLNSVYYNPILDIFGIRSQRATEDFLILDLSPSVLGGLTDVLEFNSIDNDWAYIGNLDNE